MSAAPDSLARASGVIVGGPRPDDHGWVTFDVRVGASVVLGGACPCGFGLRDGVESVDLKIANAVMSTVARYAKEHTEEMRLLYLEAARLRRKVGNAAFAGNTRRGTMSVRDPGIAKGKDCASLVAGGAAVPITIVLFADGGWVDHCDDWDIVSNADRDEAFTVCLDYVLAHPDRAADAGVDVGLLAELWR